MRWLTALVYGYIGGLMVFYLCAAFGSAFWDNLYYLWSAIFEVGVVGWGVIYYSVKPPIYQRFILPIWIFSGVRLLWEAVSQVFDIWVNNSLVVAVLFLILLGVTTYIEIIQHKRIKKYV